MPTREEIKPRVIAELKKVTDKDDLAEKEGSDLKRDLGMTPLAIEGMSVPYTRISLSYAGGIRVTIADAGDCETVGDSIDLVFKRSNGKN